MVRLRGHMRAHYIAHWSKNTHPNLRKIAGRIAVAVREDTTRLAGEPMPQALPPLPADRAGLRGVRRIHIDGDAGSRSLVFDKGLQLSPRPPMQPGPHALAHLDTLSDVRQVLQDNVAATGVHGLGNDPCANLVIDVPYMARLPAGDSRQQLSCRLRTVALKPLAERQEAIARLSELSASVQSAVAGRGNDVFTKIDPDNAVILRNGRVGNLQDDVQIPPIAFAEQLGFADSSSVKIGLLEPPDPQLNPFAAGHGKQRHNRTGKPKGSGVNVDRGVRTKSKGLPRPAVGTMGPQAPRNGSNRIARHLRTKSRKALANGVVGKVMEFHTVAARLRKGHFCYSIASRGKRQLQAGHFFKLLVRRGQQNRNRALHAPQTTCRVCHTPGLLQERRFLPDLNAALSAPTIR
jgi:hypothetical protein